MFDFLSYVRESGMEIKIIPPGEGVLICLEVREKESQFFEHHEITDAEAAGCGNIDEYTRKVLDGMAARIGQRKAKEYANRHKGNQRRDIEKLFRGE